MISIVTCIDTSFLIKIVGIYRWAYDLNVWQCAHRLGHYDVLLLDPFYVFVVLARLAILFNRSPKPEACWAGKS